MATKDQINLVKASHRRIKELLEGTYIEARVSYTSADDTLKIVFSKRYKCNRATLEVTRCTSLREVSTNSGIIEHIVREMTHEMGPKKAYYTSPEAFCAELDSLLHAYKSAANDRQLSRCIRVATPDIHIVIHGHNRGYELNAPNGNGGRNGVYPLPLDYEAADAYFVDLMDECTDGGYSRWVAAGMPKKFDPVDRSSTMTWSQFLMDTAPRVVNSFIPPTRVFPMPDTLFGLPVVWADEAQTPTQDNGVEPPLGTIRYINEECFDNTPLSAIQGVRVSCTWLDEVHQILSSPLDAFGNPLENNTDAPYQY
jgi:hypothetical protein